MSRPRVPGIALLLLAAALFLSACGGGASPSSAPASVAGSSGAGSSVVASPSAIDAARAELDRALVALERIHPEPFHAVERATFVADLAALKASLPELSPEQAAVELMRIWAQLSTERDGHQLALFGDPDADPILPIKVYEFEEGVYITAALSPNEDLAGSRITAIEGTPIEEVLRRLEPLVPRDGPATVPAFRPIYLLHAIVLRGLGLADAGSISISVAGAGGERDLDLEPIPASRFNEWAGWLAYTGLAAHPDLPYTQPTNDHLSVELLTDAAVYVRYSQVQSFSTADLDLLRELAARPGVERVIVDIRQNPGGNNFTYPPLVSALSDPAIDQPGRLVLLTDRITFSAASNFATVVEQGTSALFAGEPMGGGLNFWNDVDWIELRDFVVPMRLGISTRYWEKSTPDDARLSIEPDLAMPVRAADYFAGRDPLLEAVLAGIEP